jgi:DNA-binding transcriptional LysR family regulator
VPGGILADRLGRVRAILAGWDRLRARVRRASRSSRGRTRCGASSPSTRCSTR